MRERSTFSLSLSLSCASCVCRPCVLEKIRASFDTVSRKSNRILSQRSKVANNRPNHTFKAQLPQRVDCRLELPAVCLEVRRVSEGKTAEVQGKTLHSGLTKWTRGFLQCTASPNPCRRGEGRGIEASRRLEGPAGAPRPGVEEEGGGGVSRVPLSLYKGLSRSATFTWWR